MSGKLFIMAGLAVAFGATSYVGGNYYLENQERALEQRLNEIDANRPTVEAVELAKVVVATQELKFGEVIDESMLKVVDWPQDAFPDGAFTATSDIVLDGNRRILTPIFPGEPIITAKITGEDGRAGLAGVIAHGMRAVTIPVNTVNGVGGFVQPGDRVDILLIRGDETANTEVMMENVKVLTVDQNAGSRNETAQVADSVTVETNTKGAQKIAQGLSIGSLSLVLRSAGDTAAIDNSNGLSGLLADDQPKTTSIKVVAGDNIQEYQVTVEGANNAINANNNNN